MSKRFTASDKWSDPWFFGLSTLDKLAWLYILDTCNHAGIWQANWRLLNVMLGQEYQYDSSKFAGRIIEIAPEKLFIPKFIEFQYGELTTDSKVHSAVIAALNKEGVWKGYAKGRYTLGPPLAHPRPTPMDKDKAKDKVKDVSSKTAVKDQEGFSFDAVWSRYPRKLGRKLAERHFNASVKTPQDYADIQNALDCFIREMRKEGRPDDKIPYGVTWINNWRDWVNYGGVMMPKPPAPPPRPVEPPPRENTHEEMLEMHVLTVNLLKRCPNGATCELCSEIAAQGVKQDVH